MLEKEMITSISLLSKIPEVDVKKVFKNLILQIFLNYTQNKTSYIPYFGYINLKYEGDICKSDKLEAVLKLDINFDEYLKKNIGLYEDGDETDIEKSLKKKLKNDLLLKLK